MNTPPATTREHHPVVVVGAGQAGLSLSWHLTRRGVDHVLLERGTTAHEWRDGRWDAFTLVTPNFQCRLPGWSYTGEFAGTDPDGFMERDEVHRFVTEYARSFAAPVREGVAVTSLRQHGGGFALSTSAGEFSADQVVIATGGYHVPVVPAAAERLPRDVVQLHSSAYRSAQRLPEGAVLVVGSGQSGAQIAEDLHLAGRRVHLAVGNAPRCARTYRGRDCIAWLEDMGTYDVTAGEVPGGAAAQEKTNHYMTGRDGGRDIDLRAFAREGMGLHGRLEDVRDGVARFAPTLEQALDHADSVMESIKDVIDRHISARGIDAPNEARYVPVWRPEQEVTELDLAAAGITSVVWSVGYRADHRWVELGVFDGRGRPRQTRGVTGTPGLFFLGLPWMHTWGSGRFAGIARDAEFLADQLTAGAARLPPPSSPASRPASTGLAASHLTAAR
ncbi:MSMEG_0569 family flavin-dependent oxidoreductase [Kineococcus radiotolerans]|uniref:FAD dependent oxidoreductase n=1 Tax=Kineococcus radiotolerans (strain ATCC BAA-149 / DSM 14245 / SRS30216) TaxID=266940 RepID=A6W9Q2_KINRD|nr:MSMEG_0569 family flavin-dependent oxidoreductase [Kineococcus radiotolerans]ABS03541.1 FAD dependent oxidoreductase [Kineococcus radiotolerans SRS30216 = ATCC BAA-149]